MTETLTQTAYGLITGKLDSKKSGPVILSWEEAQAVQDALRPGARSLSTEELVSTAKLVHLLTEEFKNLAPDDDGTPWELEDYAIEAVRFLGQYQYEAPRQQGEIPGNEEVERVAEAICRVHWPTQFRAIMDERNARTEVYVDSAKAAIAAMSPKRESGDRLVKDLAMLCKRLAFRLGRGRAKQADKDAARSAMEFLVRHNLQGSVLREMAEGDYLGKNQNMTENTGIEAHKSRDA